MSSSSVAQYRRSGLAISRKQGMCYDAGDCVVIWLGWWASTAAVSALQPWCLRVCSWYIWVYVALAGVLHGFP